jgi:hypothetical protein
VIRGTLAALGAMSVLVCVGCGSSQPTAHGFFDMKTLEREIKKNSLNAKSPWADYPAEVTCLKTATLEATCALTYHELNGSGRGEANEKVTIAADGNTYEASETPEIQPVQ